MLAPSVVVNRHPESAHNGEELYRGGFYFALKTSADLAPKAASALSKGKIGLSARHRRCEARGEGHKPELLHPSPRASGYHAIAIPKASFDKALARISHQPGIPRHRASW